MREKIFFVLRVLTGALFIFSGFSKLTEPYQNFLAVIYGYKILSGAPALYFAMIVPWVEYIAGVFFVLGLWTPFSLVGLWALNSSFLVAVSSAMIRKIPLKDCGCFGEGILSLPLWQILILDSALWIIFALSFFSSKNPDLSFDKYFSTRK